LQLTENEADLIRQAKDGDERAFRKIFDAYQHPVYNFIYRMIGHTEDAADATQEVFFKVYKKLVTLRDIKYFSTWLFSIAKNEAITAARRGKNKKHDSLDLLADRILSPDQNAGQSFDPDQQIVQEEFEIIFQKILLEIPEIYRMAFVLGVLEELSYEEVAQILGCSVGNVKSRVFRARSHIAKRMEKAYALKI
jgi:RNA polymerase sigma-70 factor (ECF subfamily)